MLKLIANKIKFFCCEGAGFRLSGIKIIIFLIISLILSGRSLNAAKPIAAVAGVKAGSMKMMSVSSLLESQLVNIINSAGVFSILNPDLLKDQLNRYGCLDEECILAFARTAKINLIVRAYVEDKGNSIVYTIYGHGIDAPYFGKIIYKYSAEIPVAGLNISTIEYNYISEEHAAYFIAGLLKNYKAQIFVKTVKNTPVLDSDENINGTFDLYRYDKNYSGSDNILIFKNTGKVNIENNNINSLSSAILIDDNDFIFLTFNNKAEFIEKYFYGRKREMVFDDKAFADTAILFFSTIPASALMPALAPLSYYRYGDYTGLSLWAINSMPYLYIEYKGLKNRPDSYKDDKRDISRQNTANYYFGLYMLFCGGMPLIMDAFGNRMLYLAAAYQGKQPYMGNTASAIYLSLISGGGGMFYKGYRPEGYLYFHLHNILLYMALKEFSGAKTYNRATDSYINEGRNKKKAYTYLGALGILKAIEVTHIILVKDKIKNGNVLEESYGFEPAVYKDSLGLNFGAQYTVRY
jgi:hypothetical protein